MREKSDLRGGLESPRARNRRRGRELAAISPEKRREKRRTHRCFLSGKTLIGNFGEEVKE